VESDNERHVCNLKGGFICARKYNCGIPGTDTCAPLGEKCAGRACQEEKKFRSIGSPNCDTTLAPE
jgi:hypothetical protein